MKSVLFLLTCMLPCIVSAQTIEASASRPEEDSVRAYYIRHFPDYFFIYPVLKQRSLSFGMEKQNADENLITFKPNNSYSLGVGLYLFELNFEVAFAIPLDEKSITRFGKSSARDFQINALGKKWGVDAFYQKYEGFYVDDSRTEIVDNSPFPQRGDITSRNTGLTGTYVFNNRKFSFRSAYNYAERQVFSKGSFLLATSLSSFRVYADSSIISDEQQSIFGSDVAFKNLRYATLSIAPGYTYSIVYNNFFLNGALSIGPAQHWIKFQREGEGSQYENAINTFVAARIGLGYNGERFFGGINFITQGSNLKFEDIIFSNNNGSFKIAVGYRFLEKGKILKTRIWDLIPFKI